MALINLLQQTKNTSRQVALLDNATRQAILNAIAVVLRRNVEIILSANAKDVALMDPHDPMVDRLMLNPDRIEAMACDCESVSALPDPIGEEFDHRERGDLSLCRRRVPFGVIGVIYESRPNVTVDVATLCLRSGNAVVLKGGSEARYSNEALVHCIQEVLREHQLPISAVTLLDSGDRSLVTELITAHGLVDLLIPRGGAGLIRFVRENATVPCIETGAGVCHLFVDQSADLVRSVQVIVNAKTQRPSVCNALDTLLIHQAIAQPLFALLAPLLQEKGVKLVVDDASFTLLQPIFSASLLQHAEAEDYGQEFLSLTLAIKLVTDLDQALEHIARFSSQHSEAILTEDTVHQERFLSVVDAAAVYVNASTRFTDGGQFGLGCEVGISTQKMHARGPMGLEALTTYKWLGRGDYSIRS